MSTPIEIVIDLYYDGLIDEEDLQVAIEDKSHESDR